MLKRIYTKSVKLTNKQQRFVDSYDGDIKKTAKKAGLSYGYCRRLVTKTNILEAIRYRQDTEIRPRTIANRQQRQKFWNETMRDEKQDMRDRLRASELLGRSEADFVKHLVVIEENVLTDNECEEIRQLFRRAFE